MKKYVFMFLSTALFAALNPPISVVVNGGSLSTGYLPACDSTTGTCLTALTNGGKLWSHVAAINQTDSVTSTAMTVGPISTAPSTSTSQKFYVYSYGTGAWDDIAVFNNLFVKLEGSTTATGTLILSVW